MVIIPDVGRLVSLSQEITESYKQYMHLTPEYLAIHLKGKVIVDKIREIPYKMGGY